MHPRKSIVTTRLLGAVLGAILGCTRVQTHPAEPGDSSSVRVTAQLPDLVRALRPGTIFVVDGVPVVDTAKVLALRPADIRSIALGHASDCFQPQQRGCLILIVDTRQTSQRP
jgi:hypothetical protein